MKTIRECLILPKSGHRLLIIEAILDKPAPRSMVVIATVMGIMTINRKLLQY